MTVVREAREAESAGGDSRGRVAELGAIRESVLAGPSERATEAQ
ncbi:hypothetical protein ABH925_007067, partial [Streptacidiphilus sp. EB129]